MSVRDIAQVLGGRIVAEDPQIDDTVTGAVFTDSRLVEPGGIFFAMPGKESDGHLFVDDAVARGAVLLVVERELSTGIPQIVVPSGVESLSDLARVVVARVRAGGQLKVVAVTGSNGKTTTKNMLRTILSAEGPTIAPVGSFNNEVGAPISMLGIDLSTRYLVIEMGANAVGDVRKLVSVANPDVGIVLMVGMAHIETFGSVEAITSAKSEMVTDLLADSTAVVNADDPRVVAMAEMTRARVVTFGLAAGADVRAESIETTIDGTSFTAVIDGSSRRVQLKIIGDHHVSNAVASLAAVRALGVDMDDAITALEAMDVAERWRMQRTVTADGITIINDAYNANPDSMRAALRTLAMITRGSRRSFAVVGEMAELGDHALEEHDRIGRLAVRLNVDQLIVIGNGARHIHSAAGLEGSWDGESIFVESSDEAFDVLGGLLRDGDVVLVKSSNTAGLRFLGDRLAGIMT